MRMSLRRGLPAERAMGWRRPAQRAPAGATGTGTLRGRAAWFWDQSDVDPTDNTASFRIVVG